VNGWLSDFRHVKAELGEIATRNPSPATTINVGINVKIVDVTVDLICKMKILLSLGDGQSAGVSKGELAEKNSCEFQESCQNMVRSSL
jgi:hypothetical protein